jgi:hypothetical protein
MSLEKENCFLQSADQALHRLDACRGDNGKRRLLRCVESRERSFSKIEGSAEEYPSCGDVVALTCRRQHGEIANCPGGNCFTPRCFEIEYYRRTLMVALIGSVRDARRLETVLCAVHLSHAASKLSTCSDTIVTILTRFQRSTAWLQPGITEGKRTFAAN